MSFGQKNLLGVPIPPGNAHLQKLSLGGQNATASDGMLWTDGAGSLVLMASIALMIGAAPTPAAWVSGQRYIAGQLVVSAGVNYVCIQSVASATAPASDSTNWAALNVDILNILCDQLQVNGQEVIGIVPLNLVVGGVGVGNGTVTVKTTAGATVLSVDASGNVVIAGTLGVTGAVSLTAALATVVQAGAGITGINGASVLMLARVREATASVNTGATLLPAVVGKGYRLSGAEITAIGGNAAATANATGVAIYGTQGGSKVALLTVVLAGLTRSTANPMTGTNSTVLADGASKIKCDSDTAITIQAVGGSDLITATNFDSVLSYVLE